MPKIPKPDKAILLSRRTSINQVLPRNEGMLKSNPTMLVKNTGRDFSMATMIEPNRGMFDNHD
jgi:hypothetical protein